MTLKLLLSIPCSIELNCSEQKEVVLGLHVKIIIREKNYHFAMFIQGSPNRCFQNANF